MDTSSAALDAKGFSVVRVYKISDLSADSKPALIGSPTRSGTPGKFSLPFSSIVFKGQLFVADTGYRKVHIWKHIEDAIAGKDEDTILGSLEPHPVNEIGRNKLFNPANLAFDGSYLWVGEVKFSERLLRFAVH